MPHISITAETIAYFGDIPISNSFVTSILGFFIFLGLAYFYKIQSEKEIKLPFFYFIHLLVSGVYGFFKSILKENTKQYFPLVGGIFFFALVQNWLGLAPGVGSILIEEVHTAGENYEIEESIDSVVDIGKTEEKTHHMIPIFRAATADLNTTLALALVSFFSIQYAGITHLGAGGYFRKFFSGFNPLSIFVGFLEIISELSKILSFSFRLFGNIVAGEVLITIIAFLIPIGASFPFLLFEIFVGIMQAFVFSVLTAAFIKLAITKTH